jgi:hypothetical protein
VALTADEVQISRRCPPVPVHLVLVVYGQMYTEFTSRKADKQPGNDESVSPKRNAVARSHVPSGRRASQALTPSYLSSTSRAHQSPWW